MAHEFTHNTIMNDCHSSLCVKCGAAAGTAVLWYGLSVSRSDIVYSQLIGLDGS